MKFKIWGNIDTVVQIFISEHKAEEELKYKEKVYESTRLIKPSHGLDCRLSSYTFDTQVRQDNLKVEKWGEKSYPQHSPTSV